LQDVLLFRKHTSRRNWKITANKEY